MCYFRLGPIQESEIWLLIKTLLSCAERTCQFTDKQDIPPEVIVETLENTAVWYCGFILIKYEPIE